MNYSGSVRMAHMINTRITAIIVLKSFYKYLIAIQLNPGLVLRSLKAFPRYIQERRAFRKSFRVMEWPLGLYPILLDYGAQSANLGEYFWQDLYVAKRIIEENPRRHIDVGSRVDGFIAHLITVRSVEIYDIRPLSANIDRVTFTQWDIVKPRVDLVEVSDCVSCLHTLEHIGLGRYGDQLDPDGWKKGLNSLASLVECGGGLWLSVPIGIQRVEFNAHRVFSPATIRDAAKSCGLILEEFHYLENKEIIDSVSIECDFLRLADVNYALGIFYFRKIKNGD